MATKMALCVGINYAGTPAELGGCVNDAHDWGALLEARGYQVQYLIEATATRDVILASLDYMRRTVGFRGRAVFTYSGHGTFTPDIDGDEVDGFDEAFVPHNYARAGLVTDDDLYRVAGKRRIGSRWVTISDSCHSGTLSRDLAGLDKVARFLPPERAITDERVLDLARQSVTVDEPVVVSRGTSRNSGLLLAACREEEVAYDIEVDGRGQGAFTAAAFASLAAASISYQDWYDTIRTQLPSRQYAQTPQLQATRTQAQWTPFD